MRFSKKINPEKNHHIRTGLYTMGFVGYIHFLSSLASVVNRKNWYELNPYHLINVDRFLGGHASNPLVFISGWVIFAAIMVGFYKLVMAKKVSG